METSTVNKKENSCWKTRSKNEKRLIAVITLLLLIVIGLIVALAIPNRDDDVCTTKKCIQSSASILGIMDSSVDPCDDFYKFACGNFLKETEIPEDEVSISSNFDLKKKVSRQLKSVVEEAVSEQDPHYLKLAKNLYKSCMNIDQIDREGLAFVGRAFKELGGWPSIEPHWREQSFDWIKLEDQFRRMGWQLSFFFGIDVTTDVKNPSKHILTLTQLSIPGMFEKGLNDSTVSALSDLIVKVSVVFGADQSTAISDMKDVLQLIATLSTFETWDPRKNMSAKYNPVTLREFQSQHRNLPWLKIINNILYSGGELKPDDLINIAAPIYFQKLDEFLPTVKKRTLANYMFLLVLKTSVKYLPTTLQDMQQSDFIKKSYGKMKASPRWQTCVSDVKLLNIAASSIYVKNFFDENIKTNVKVMMNDVKASFIDNLKQVEWMDFDTRKRAILKATKMKALLAYPEEILDDEKVSNFYENLSINGDEYYLKVIFNISKHFHETLISKLWANTTKYDWKMLALAYEINAYYVPEENLFDVTAAVLQSNFYNPERPQYMNYGAMGWVIGHEITHGFDIQGRQYDEDGNLCDWWQPETAQTYRNKSQCFVEQYGNITVPETGRNLNGYLSLPENIADNGGLKIAYRSYLKWLQKHKQEPLLPGLPYNQKQLFWISLASNWCIKYRKEFLKESLSSSVHAPHNYRVLVPLMNSKDFARDFSCSLGSKMNPEQKCHIW